MLNQEAHQPVLFSEVIAGLGVRDSGIYIDLTYGRGGHARALLEKLGLDGRLIVFDRDKEAVIHAAAQFNGDARVSIVHADFSEVTQELVRLGIEHVDGILMDLGVSSPQLDNPERGFSFQTLGPLDMRMNTTEGQTAAEWLAYVDEDELARVIWTLGEERYSRKIARAIIQFREIQAIDDTQILADIVRKAMPKKTPGKDSATRTFQAIRLYINQELEALQKVLKQAFDLLKPQGRLAVISFHSLEDRMVKQFFNGHIKGDKPIPPPEIPVLGEVYQASLRYICKAIRASKDELKRNPRSRSAVLRVVERL